MLGERHRSSYLTLRIVLGTLTLSLGCNVGTFDAPVNGDTGAVNDDAAVPPTPDTGAGNADAARAVDASEADAGFTDTGADAGVDAGAPQVDECDTTAECVGLYGSGATDCVNSQADDSICYCGDVPCRSVPRPNPVDCTEPGSGAFLEDGGLVIIEAESAQIPSGGGWQRRTEGTTTYLVATSNHFGNTNGQTLDYAVRIGRPGVYRLHMKSAFSGSEPTEENDSWFKIDNTADVHFFTVAGGALGSSQEFIDLRAGTTTSKTLYYPAGNAEGRPDFGRENPGRNGFFKVYRSGGGGNKWHAATIDNHGYPIYTYFPRAGDFVIQVSERSAGHRVDRFALAHIDDVSAQVPQASLNGPESRRSTTVPAPPIDCRMTGDLKQWHRAALVCTGPFGSEDCAPTFTDLRMNVSMTDGRQTIVVPGHFAADGDAGTSGAVDGYTWRAYFMPPASGQWTFTVSMRSGPGLAMSLDAAAGDPVAGLDGITGTFSIAPSDATGRDFRAQGLLEHPAGERYLRFAGSGRAFVEGGADSPENLFGFDQFDNTEKFTGGSCKGILHSFAPHLADWTANDPTWGQDERGKPLIGLINYLAEKGVNGIYIVAMSVQGDGCDGYPWTTYSGSRELFDVSKLDQWDVALSHMNAKGLLIHYVTQETENDQLLDGGALGPERRLYYREIVSRFSHHPALQWNLGEENTNTAAEVRAFADYIRALDPYDHPIVMHTFPGQKNRYEPLLGHATFNGPTLQFGNIPESAAQGLYGETRTWLERSAQAGRSWFVTATEASGSHAPTPNTAVTARQRVYWMWANVMAGGAGIEWYLKNDGAGHAYDLAVEDLREFDAHWTQTGHLVRFFNVVVQNDGVGLPRLEPANNVTATDSDWVLADPASAYIVFLRNGGSTALTTTGTGAYRVSWFDPRTGQLVDAPAIAAGTTVTLGAPPAAANQDWVVFVRR